MRTEDEILGQVQAYQEQLRHLASIRSLLERRDKLSTKTDVLLFSLVDRLETLLWVLEIEPPTSNILAQLNLFKH